jgi:hypothetical protein
LLPALREIEPRVGGVSALQVTIEQVGLGLHWLFAPHVAVVVPVGV